jgi:hypothetical protein
LKVIKSESKTTDPKVKRTNNLTSYSTQIKTRKNGSLRSNIPTLRTESLKLQLTILKKLKLRLLKTF